MLLQYRDFWLLDPSTVAPPLQLYPGVAYEERIDVTRADGKSYGGRLNTLRVAGERRTISAPLFAVTSAARAQLHAWWRGQATLLWIVDSVNAGLAKTLRVRVANQALPLGQAYAARADLWQGGLVLREVLGQDYVTGVPFQLDNATQGQLDNLQDLLL